MEYKDFVEQVKEQIKYFLPGKFADADVSYRITCNNGNQRTLINP